jgi:hypothetical protein
MAGLLVGSLPLVIVWHSPSSTCMGDDRSGEGIEAGIA